MNNSQARDLAVRWFERVWQERSREAFFEWMHEDAEGHQEGGPAMRGTAEFTRMFDQFLEAFPDLSLEILHVVGDGTEACVHWKVCVTQIRPFEPIPASGVRWCAFPAWENFDRSGLLVHQGALVQKLAVQAAAGAS